MSDDTETPEVVDESPPDADDDAVEDVEVTEAEVVNDTADEATDSADADNADDGADDASADDKAEPSEDAEVDRAGDADESSLDVFDTVTRERDDYLKALQQLQADFENYRKQAIRRQGDAIEHATGRLVEDLLTVLDACEAGIDHGDEGVTAVFASLLGVLERAGLERIDPLNEAFDPNAHEAVLHEPAGDDDDDVEGPVVAEVMRPGYRWKERTLRPAMVKVRG